MLYDIRLRIGHSYGVPSAHARTLARLAPLDVPGQQVVLARALSTDPTPDEREDRLDFFGNALTTVAFHRPVDRLIWTLAARVRRIALPPALDLSPPVAELAADLADHRALDGRSPHHFTQASPRAPHDPPIAAFAHETAQAGDTARQAVARLGAALHALMQFDPEATNVDTPPATAFALRRGVCQDFSHVMIVGLRALGIPAGYVSGFLRTEPPKGQPRLEGADAMHAWVAAWCGAETGWIEYDPTNACAVALDHIRVAMGRDYADVSPLRGMLHTSGPQTSVHAVDVVPVISPAIPAPS